MSANMNEVNEVEELVCSHCGQVIDGNHFEVDGDTLCDECASELTALCSDCGERFYIDEDRGDEWCFLCPSCYDDHWTHCERCGNLVRMSDTRSPDWGEYEDRDLCDDCYERERENREKVIRDYYYKPDPIFYGTGKLFMGVELEVDGAGEDHEYADKVRSVFNADHELAYFKHDGSLEDGFEIVTHPMTLEYHRENAPWEDVVAECKRLGYTSHNAGTCGLHVHVSRDAFGPDYVAQDNNIARVLYFFEKNWDELLKFSRRTQHQLDQWASRYGYEHNPKDILDKAKDSSRYSAINLQNSSTIEFRMFRGTLKYNTIIATLELIKIVCDLAVSSTDKEMQDLSWTQFVSNINVDEYPELIQYLKERQIYVNDPVESEEEV